MAEDKSLDLIGLGRLAKAIPQAAWKRVVDTACTTFDKVVAPITETTSGIGRLIGAKFDNLIDAEKVIVAKTVQTASDKADQSGKHANAEFNHLILCKIIEHAQAQADASIRELWANLLAREMTDGAVHPELTDVLARLTIKDAMLLLEIANKEKDKASKLFKSVAELTASISILGMTLTVKSSTATFHHIILERLGLVRSTDLGWRLTAFGVAFLEAVTPLTDGPKGKNEPRRQT